MRTRDETMEKVERTNGVIESDPGAWLKLNLAIGKPMRESPISALAPFLFPGDREYQKEFSEWGEIAWKPLLETYGKEPVKVEMTR